MPARARCQSCGVPLPPGAARCPSCGHQQGDVVTIEVGGPGGGRVPPTVPGPKKSRRRDALLLVAVAVIVVGALAFAGRGGGSGGQSADRSTPPTDPTTTTSIRRPRPSITTTTALTALPGPLLGGTTGVRLLVSRSGNFTVVDLDTGQILDIADDLTDSQVIATKSGFFVAGGGQGRVRYVAAPYDTAPLELETAVPGQIFRSVADDRIWVLGYGPDSTVTEFDTSGEVTRGPIPLPYDNVVAMAAVAEGLVITMRGGIYIMDFDGQRLHRIGYGDVLGGRGSTVATIGCDDAGACDLQLIDTGTGEVRRIDTQEDFGDGYYEARFSPDGTLLAIALNYPGPPDTDSRIVVVDLGTGTTKSFPLARRNDCCGLPVSWSLDSQWLFWANRDTVSAWPRGADEPIAIQPGRPPFTSVTVVG